MPRHYDRRFWPFLSLICAFALLSILIQSRSNADIVGTIHDLSGNGERPPQQACAMCHAERPAPVAASVHFAPYESPTLKSVPGQPDGISRLCLSCHDGTISSDSHIGTVKTEAASGDMGWDLRDDHPVSFIYDSALAAKVRNLKDPAISPSGLGGTIASDLLQDGKLQCVSCHSPHGTGNNPMLIVKSNVGSSLCFTCHNL